MPNKNPNVTFDFCSWRYRKAFRIKKGETKCSFVSQFYPTFFLLIQVRLDMRKPDKHANPWPYAVHVNIGSLSFRNFYISGAFYFAIY